MKSSIYLVTSISMLVFPSIAMAQGCAAGAPAGNTVISSQPEYVIGQPKKVEVDDNGNIKTLNYLKLGKLAIFEGDIVIGDADQIEFASQAGPIKTLRSSGVGGGELTPFGYMSRSVIGGARRWTGNTIPYVMDPALGSSEIVISAMKAWEKDTNIKFTERTSLNSSQYKNYVYFTNGNQPGVCLSYGVGMMGGQQRVELVPDCRFGEILHEIGHVIGLDHEQNRADRNNYVTVNVGNIISGYVDQFEQRPSLYKDIGTYDYDSIMHYQDTGFTCNRQKTIEAVNQLPPGVHLGQRTHVSGGDAKAVNMFYK